MAAKFADHAEPVHVDESGHGTFVSYVTGFVVSVILTALAFYFVMAKPGFLSPRGIMGAIVLLAVVQVIVHLIFFLHMNGSSAHRWNLLAFCFTVMVVFLLIGGSVWIMASATHTMMLMPDGTTGTM